MRRRGRDARAAPSRGPGRYRAQGRAVEARQQSVRSRRPRRGPREDRQPRRRARGLCPTTSRPRRRRYRTDSEAAVNTNDRPRRRARGVRRRVQGQQVRRVRSTPSRRPNEHVHGGVEDRVPTWIFTSARWSWTAGAYLRATALEAADALEFVKGAAMAAVRAYVLTVEAFAEAVIKLIRKAASWFKAFNEIGAAADALNIGITPGHDAAEGADLEPVQHPRPAAGYRAARGRDARRRHREDDRERERRGRSARGSRRRRREVYPRTAIGCLAAAGVPTFFDDYDPPPRGDASTTNATVERRSAIAYAERDAARKRRREGNGSRTKRTRRRRSWKTNARSFGSDRERDAGERHRRGRGTRRTPRARPRLKPRRTSKRSSATRATPTARRGSGVAPPNLENVESAMRVLSALFDALLAADLVYRVVRSFQAVAKHFSHKNSLPPDLISPRRTRRRRRTRRKKRRRSSCDTRK